MNHNPTGDLDLDLDAIEARANAATPGPWGAYTFGGDTLIEIAADLEETGTGYRARREICRLEDEPMDNDPQHREWTAEEDWAQVQADAEFIAHAPADVAALLAEVRRQRDEVAPFTDSERTMLAYALDEAQEHIWSRDGFTNEDQAAVDSLRARLEASTAPVPSSHTPEAPTPHTGRHMAADGRTEAATGTDRGEQ